MTQEQANWEWMDARVKVLEANHKIQLEISNKQMEYIKLLEEGLESALALNKAQAGRQDK
jgi:hypothetical protein